MKKDHAYCSSSKEGWDPNRREDHQKMHPREVVESEESLKELQKVSLYDP